MSSSESERVRFSGDLIGESDDGVWLSLILARISATISSGAPNVNFRKISVRKTI